MNFDEVEMKFVKIVNLYDVRYDLKFNSNIPSGKIDFPQSLKVDFPNKL